MALSPEEWLAQQGQQAPAPSGGVMSPEQWAASQTQQPAAGAPDATQQPQAAPQSEQSPTQVPPEPATQGWILNMLDNPIMKGLIRHASPDEQTAKLAIGTIEQGAHKYRTATEQGALHAVTGMASQAGAGLGAIPAAMQGMPPSAEDVAKAEQRTTYQPTSPEAQQYQKDFGELMKPVSDFWGSLKKGIGGRVMESTHSPLLAAAGYTLPDAIVAALPFAGKLLPKTAVESTVADTLKASAAQPELASGIHKLTNAVEQGHLPPEQLQTAIQGAKDHIVSIQGKAVYDRLSTAAQDLAEGKPNAIKEIQQTADEIGAAGQQPAIAKSMENGWHNITSDPAAIEAIKQKVDPGMVTAMRGSTPETKAKMLEMTNTAEQLKKNPMYKGGFTRPGDIAGQSLLDRVNFLKAKNVEAGKAIEKAAEELKGKQVDMSTPINNFKSNLEGMGVTFDENGVPNYTDSALDGRTMAPDRSAVTDMLNRLNRMNTGGTTDAWKAHILKRNISTSVKFGGAGKQGLKGDVEDLFKGLRHDTNNELRNISPAYKAANKQYEDTIQPLNDIQEQAGRKIDIFGPNADKSLGKTLRGLTSNIVKRENIINAINDINSTAAKYGGEFKDDLMTQMLYADQLDSLFGPYAKTSLSGETAKAVKHGIEATDLMTGGKTVASRAAVRAASEGINKMRGINTENTFKALKTLLTRQ